MQVHELTTAPPLGRLYLKAAAGMARRKRAGDDLPESALVLRDARIDPENLAEYTRVCGFRLRDTLPATYPHLLGFPLQVQLMTEPDFPFSAVGVVHTRNAIVQHRPVMLAEPLTLRVVARDLRPHPKGREFDLDVEATVDGEVVWSSVSTYLHRGSPNGDGGESPPDLDAPSEGPPDARWHVPSDTGRRYAAVSGDGNPIHLHPLAAKAFGFPRHIAHGMWHKARCLAAFEGRLPDAFEVDVAFKRPLLLPADVAFRSRHVGDGWSFSLRDDDTDEPHLAGAISPVG